METVEFRQPLLPSEHFILEIQELEFPLSRLSRFHKFNQDKNVVNFTLHLHYYSAMANKTETMPPGAPITNVNFCLQPWQAGWVWSKTESRIMAEYTTTQEIFRLLHPVMKLAKHLKRRNSIWKTSDVTYKIWGQNKVFWGIPDNENRYNLRNVGNSFHSETTNRKRILSCTIVRHSTGWLKINAIILDTCSICQKTKLQWNQKLQKENVGNYHRLRRCTHSVFSSCLINWTVEATDIIRQRALVLVLIKFWTR